MRFERLCFQVNLPSRGWENALLLLLCQDWGILVMARPDLVKVSLPGPHAGQQGVTEPKWQLLRKIVQHDPRDSGRRLHKKAPDDSVI